MTPTGSRTIFLSAAEPSADRIGASLLRALRARLPKARFVGVAGPQMQAAGCHTLYDMTPRAAMLAGAARNVLAAWVMLRRVRRYLRVNRPDLVVLLDSPALHLRMAKRAKAWQLPVLYYIAPQVWAWGEYRLKAIRRCVDQMACILPFEEAYFTRHGIPARFVGHPLFEALADTQPDPERVAALRARGQPVLGLLPGSRRHVVQEILPGQLQVARAVKQEYPAATVLISAANEQAQAVIAPRRQDAGFATQVIVGEPSELIAASDLVLAASGTATLHVAEQGKPMIIMYNASRWGYWLIGRRLIHTPHLALINILAGHQIVPEFMPYYRSTRPIAEKALALLASPQQRALMSEAVSEVVRPLRAGRASANVAELALQMMGVRGGCGPGESSGV